VHNEKAHYVQLNRLAIYLVTSSYPAHSYKEERKQMYVCQNSMGTAMKLTNESNSCFQWRREARQRTFTEI